MNFAELITWGMTAGAGALAYWLMSKIAIVETLTAEVKRIVSFALSSLIAIAFWWLGVLMRYETIPLLDSGAVDGRRLVEVLFMVAAGATGLAQLIHGRVVLAKKIKIASSSSPCGCCCE